MFEFSKNRIYVKEPSSVYVCKVSKKYLLKWPNFGILIVENGRFLRCSLKFLCFYDFQISSDLGRSKSVLGSFFSFCTKTAPKTCFTPPKHKFPASPLLDLVTLNDLYLEYAHRKLEMRLRSVPHTIHAVILTYFHFIRL